MRLAAPVLRGCSRRCSRTCRRWPRLRADRVSLRTTRARRTPRRQTRPSIVRWPGGRLPFREPVRQSSKGVRVRRIGARENRREVLSALQERDPVKFPATDDRVNEPGERRRGTAGRGRMAGRSSSSGRTAASPGKSRFQNSGAYGFSRFARFVMLCAQVQCASKFNLPIATSWPRWSWSCTSPRRCDGRKTRN